MLSDFLKAAVSSKVGKISGDLAQYWDNQVNSTKLSVVVVILTQLSGRKFYSVHCNAPCHITESNSCFITVCWFMNLIVLNGAGFSVLGFG